MTFSWPRLASWVIALAVGAVYATACTIAHAYTLGAFPLGLVLAIVGIAALLAAVRLLTADRWAAMAAGSGAVIATLVFSGAGPGGSVVVPTGPAGVVWMVSVSIAAVVAVAWPDLSRPPAAAGVDGGAN